ncbi:MAG: RtcB family protein [Candidatus Electrothrix sp. AR4]|nr:RtcB family protein [Candidatus Electrothrix sp. AR4]
MKKVISSEKRPIKLWLDDIEDTAWKQARNLANLPFTYRHVAIMADAHAGYGMPIGGVLACEGVVIPNAVGVDIGCGMCAVQTSLKNIDRNTLKRILGSEKSGEGIRALIPTGFRHHKEACDAALMPDPARLDSVKKSVVREQFLSGRKQLGTLGGGNHFIEIQQGDDGYIWLMIHSGSRNIGLKVAKQYNQLACRMNEQWHSAVPPKWQLAFFPLDSRQAEDYLAEMRYCVDFALANRTLMMERLKHAVRTAVHAFTDEEVRFMRFINIAHNYAAMEHHFCRDVMVHRKGATRARLSEYGVIPGSQGSRSFIVRGKGNTDSFSSCSHGAGRILGRKQAQRTLDLDQEQKRLDELGVLHGLRGKHDLDEAAGAYKDIEAVMANQVDLVEIEVTLTPLAVIKG